MNNLTAAAGIANIATFTIIGYHMIALTIDDYISALELVSIEWDNSITGIFSQYMKPVWCAIGEAISMTSSWVRCNRSA